MSCAAQALNLSPKSICFSTCLQRGKGYSSKRDAPRHTLNVFFLFFASLLK